ncbi:MAG: NarK/NasA family nitrate transporter [Azospirillaceae bacterium]|nr:NarK/NasA family nitrate transporter [Azospirillaceae bacterium]
MNRAFLKAGHLPTLVASFLYFDVSFMVWVLLGPLGVLIAKDLHLDPGQKGLMVATPVLAGAVLRIVNGILADQLKPRLTGIIMQIVVILGLLTAWLIDIDSFNQVLALGLVLGVAGASFAVALPLASYWYPPHYQGIALGIAGAGNSGTVLASLFAPTLAVLFGWRNVLGLAALPLAVVLVLFIILARNSPNCPPRKSLADYRRILGTGDAWWLMFFYAVSFGGFVGLSSFLPIYFNDQYGLPPISAGYLTAGCVFAGSLARPFGGALADRMGGLRTLSGVYAIAALALVVVSRDLPTVIPAFAVLIIGMAALGMGNGAVFQLVPQRFGREVGIMTGLVGMTGGIGGFYLAASLGYAKQLTGSYSAGFLIFAVLALLGLAGIVGVRSRWRRTWRGAAALTSARI